MQSVVPAELIIIDASPDDATRRVVLTFAGQMQAFGCRVLWQPAKQAGAAAQRNQGIGLATQSVLCFFDDDVLFESDCFARLWRALQADPGLGGINAMIVNQRYLPPRPVSRWMFRMMAGHRHASYAGRVLGPAINILPEDRDELPEVVSVEWLNLGCTLYRREAMPAPAFAGHFAGYSLMEDLTLSLTVGKKWKLANARTARIYHDSRPGAYKDKLVARSRAQERPAVLARACRLGPLIGLEWTRPRTVRRIDSGDLRKFKTTLESSGDVLKGIERVEAEARAKIGSRG